MARYLFRCTCAATKELVQPMSADLPTDLPCAVNGCQGRAQRVYEPPAAIHFRGPGFYSTDVKGRTERKRRPNPGDDLARTHDPAAAAIVR